MSRCSGNRGTEKFQAWRSSPEVMSNAPWLI
jgi:hypothetical protein